MANNITPWFPQPGMGGLMLSFGILMSLISRGILEVETAHEILNEQISTLEDLQSHSGTGAGARAQIASGLTDLLYLKKQLQTFPHTRLPD
jgi:hypothetical protein